VRLISSVPAHLDPNAARHEENLALVRRARAETVRL
jgi:hypothetical protein